jgi:hypothetical protein
MLSFVWFGANLQGTLYTQYRSIEASKHFFLYILFIKLHIKSRFLLLNTCGIQGAT